MAKRTVNLEMLCDKCGKPQQMDKEKSNANWDVYNANAVCECGGTFVMYIDGKPINRHEQS